MINKIFVFHFTFLAGFRNPLVGVVTEMKRTNVEKLSALYRLFGNLRIDKFSRETCECQARVRQWKRLKYDDVW